MSDIRVLCIGDVCGPAGIGILKKRLRVVKQREGADFTIVEGENCSLYGLTPAQAEELFDAGADAVTLGNHAFGKREINDYLDENGRLLRPANMRGDLPGRGEGIFQIDKDGRTFRLGLAVFMCRVGMAIICESPFHAADAALKRMAGRADGVIVDIHGEATSEKVAFGHHVAGRVSAVFGSHTHVLTADARIINGTGYITDVGMTGPEDSVIGVRTESSLEFFLSDGVVKKYKSAEGDGPMCGVLFDVGWDGKCTGVRAFAER